MVYKSVKPQRCFPLLPVFLSASLNRLSAKTFTPFFRISLFLCNFVLLKLIMAICTMALIILFREDAAHIFLFCYSVNTSIARPFCTKTDMRREFQFIQYLIQIPVFRQISGKTDFSDLRIPEKKFNVIPTPQFMNHLF